MANKNLILGLILALMVFAIGGIAYTQVSNRYIENCYGEMNLSQKQDFDSFTIYYEEQLPNNNFTITFEPSYFYLEYNVVDEGNTYNFTAADIFRKCYVEKSNKNTAYGYCIYDMTYRGEMELRQYYNIRAAKKQVEERYHTNMSIKGKQNEVKCMVIGG